MPLDDITPAAASNSDSEDEPDLSDKLTREYLEMVANWTRSDEDNRQK